MLTPGSPIELEAMVSDVPLVVGGTIVAVSPELVTVRVAVAKGAFLPIEQGMEITGDVIHRSEIVTFDTVVLARSRAGGGVELELRPPESYREERRDFYRFEYRLPVAVRILDDEGKPVARYHTETLDIGGGGIGVRSKERVDVGANVSLRIQLEDDEAERLKVEGVAVRVVEEPGLRHERQYRVGIVFKSISEPDRQRLIHFIFAKQRELRAKGFL